MKYRVMGSLVAAAVATTGLIAEVPTMSSAAPVAAPASTASADEVETAASSYKLVWRDEFNGSSKTLPKHWQVRPAVQVSRPCTTTTAAMGRVKNGKALISAAKDNSRAKSSKCPKGWLYNAQFTTEKSAQFLYGKFAARIKFQKESGVHGGFFLYYPPGVYPKVPASDVPGSRGAEIDTVEYFGERNTGEGIKGGIQNSVYWQRKRADGSIALVKEGGRKNVRKHLKKGRTPADGFHTYSVEWTPTQYIFKFDGHVTMRLKRGISRRPQYLYLSMLSSPFEAKYLRYREMPATMQVDWVRVWQKR